MFGFLTEHTVLVYLALVKKKQEKLKTEWF